MAKQPSKKKNASRSQPSTSLPAGGSIAARLAKPTPQQIEAAKQKYEEGILARGEAVPQGQPLKPGATHQIVGHRADGSPILSRKRFSIR